jgi:hypothetical protein
MSEVQRGSLVATCAEAAGVEAPQLDHTAGPAASDHIRQSGLVAEPTHAGCTRTKMHTTDLSAANVQILYRNTQSLKPTGR